MATTNTHRTLNDYRLAPEPLDTPGHSKGRFGAAAIVLAIFLGVGAYFFYTTQRENAPAPASEATLPATGSGVEQPALMPQSGSTAGSTADSMTDSTGNAMEPAPGRVP